MAVLRLALVGAGLIGREHVSLVEDHPNAELVGISDPNPEVKQYAEEQGVRYFTDYETMLDDVQPDGCIVALPNNLHLEAGLACINRNIPSLIEKPIADTVSSARDLVDASTAKGVPVLVGHHRRHSPDIREARAAVKGGILGDLVAVNGMWLMDKPDSYFEADWRRQKGGGPLLINLIHDIDCLRYIVGEIESVQAFTSNTTRGFSVEETASVAIRFENGVLGTFLISDAVASPYSWEITSGQALYFPHQTENCYYLGGRKASLSVPSMELWQRKNDDEHWQHPLTRKQITLDGSSAYQNQIDHFLEVISSGAEPIVDAREGMMTLAATLAIDVAARENRTVKIVDML